MKIKLTNHRGSGFLSPRTEWREVEKMKNSLRNLVVGGIILGSTLAVPRPLDAQIHGHVEYIQTEKSQDSYARLRGSYKLPLNIDGFSFAEFYKKKGYFGKTYLNRPVSKAGGIEIELDHVGEPLSREGAGMNINIPWLPKDVSATVSPLPIWFDSKGQYMKNRMMLQYSFSGSLPWNFDLSGFGGWNLAAKQKPQWDYGEIALTKNLGPVKIGLNPALKSNGSFIPSLENRLIIGLKF